MCLCSVESRPSGNSPWPSCQAGLSSLPPVPSSSIVAAQPSWLQQLGLPSRDGWANSAPPALLVISHPRDSWWSDLLCAFYLAFFSAGLYNMKTQHTFPKELFILVDLTKHPDDVGGGKILCTSFPQPSSCRGQLA